MTDTNFTENDLSFEALFKNGTCLTCNYLFSSEALDYAIELREKQRRLHKGALCLIETPKSITSNLHQKLAKYIYNSRNFINKEDYHVNITKKCKLKQSSYRRAN